MPSLRSLTSSLFVSVVVIATMSATTLARISRDRDAPSSNAKVTAQCPGIAVLQSGFDRTLLGFVQTDAWKLRVRLIDWTWNGTAPPISYAGIDCVVPDQLNLAAGTNAMCQALGFTFDNAANFSFAVSQHVAISSTEFFGLVTSSFSENTQAQLKASAGGSLAVGLAGCAVKVADVAYAYELHPHGEACDWLNVSVPATARGYAGNEDAWFTAFEGMGTDFAATGTLGGVFGQEIVTTTAFFSEYTRADFDATLQANVGWDFKARGGVAVNAAQASAEFLKNVDIATSMWGGIPMANISQWLPTIPESPVVLHVDQSSVCPLVAKCGLPQVAGCEDARGNYTAYQLATKLLAPAAAILEKTLQDINVPSTTCSTAATGCAPLYTFGFEGRKCCSTVNNPRPNATALTAKAAAFVAPLTAAKSALLLKAVTKHLTQLDVLGFVAAMAPYVAAAKKGRTTRTLCSTSYHQGGMPSWAVAICGNPRPTQNTYNESAFPCTNYGCFHPCPAPTHIHGCSENDHARWVCPWPCPKPPSVVEDVVASWPTYLGA